jgi:hypothetical protein
MDSIVFLVQGQALGLGSVAIWGYWKALGFGE